ncbi:MAG TPA: hypothetical protein DDW23_08380 [Planctomycetes bacterium]|nr:hypothetical protein [Planctomycetota bacterium]
MTASPQSGLAAALKTNQVGNGEDFWGDNLKAIGEKFKTSLADQITVEEPGIATFVLTDTSKSFDLAVAIQEAMWPSPLAFSIVSSGPEEVSRIRNQAIRGLKLVGKGNSFIFQLQGRSKSETLLAQEVANLHSTIIKEWTPTRTKAVRQYRELKRQVDVAIQMGVSQQAISQMLTGAHYRRLATTEAVLREWLNEPAAPGIWPLRRKQS